MTRAAWVSVTQYAKQHGVSRPTVYKWMAAKLVETFQVNRIVRVKNVEPGHLDLPPEPAPLAELPPAVAKRQARQSRSQIRLNGQVVPNVCGVYVVRHGVFVKIGCSRRLRQRLGQLQALQPTPLIIIGFAACEDFLAAATLEGDLHDACRADRFRGEWFRLSPDVVATLLRVPRAVWCQDAFKAELTS